MFLFSCKEKEIIKPPDPNRFIVKTLLTGMNEPMEVDILPDGGVLFIERPGYLKKYDPLEATVKTIGTVDVHYASENGLLGLTLDPDFADNNWIYLFYTAPDPSSTQHVSRFELVGDTLVLSSEKVLLEIPIDKDICCHMGGCLEFGPDGNLYISTGDNSLPTDFGSIDERPGHKDGDSQRTAANTFDLRGKVLRIRPLPDGSYDIPDGNLFPKVDSLTRPEIYIMGTRNPFRMSFDDETGFLYWGDLGPNPGGGQDSSRGPRTHEEINQARSAGNYGWPYLLADNKPYRDFDYANGHLGNPFVPDSLRNDSPNNTGLENLPKAKGALIWYPNTPTDLFPEVGSGGGSIMAGPVYRYDQYSESDVKLPEYYDGKLFIFEWMRNWILTAAINQDKVADLEAFLPSEKFIRPIDMKLGPDGALYVLDYGSHWYSQNDDSKLSVITYQRGNIPPVARIKADRPSGVTPLKVQLSAADSYDPDQHEKLKFVWTLANSGEVIGNSETLPFTFGTPGIHQVKLTVSDRQNATSSAIQEIEVRDTCPDLTIQFDGNRSFFYPGDGYDYAVTTGKTEAGSGSMAIDRSAIRVTLHYTPDYQSLPEFDRNSPSTGFMRGKDLIESSDCSACHLDQGFSIGPNFSKISMRYPSEQRVVERLAEKVITGGAGLWGEFSMPAHPQHSLYEAEQMVEYILSVSREWTRDQDLPVEGHFNVGDVRQGVYLLSARYSDQETGQGVTRPEASLILRHPEVSASRFDSAQGVTVTFPVGGRQPITIIEQSGAFLLFKHIDLTEIDSLFFRIGPGGNRLRIETRLYSTSGPVIGSLELDGTERGDPGYEIGSMSVAPVDGPQDIYFIFDQATSEAYHPELESIFFHVKGKELRWNLTERQ